MFFFNMRQRGHLFFIFIYLFICTFLFTEGVPHSIYVNAKGTADGNGSKNRPFNSLEQVITHLITQKYSAQKKDDIAVIIYLQSSVTIKELLLLTIPIKIVGMNNAVLSFTENTGFFVANTLFDIENCHISRSERNTEPRTVPLIYGSQSTIHLNNVVIETKDGGEMIILRNSRFFCKNTVFDTIQHAQALLLRAEKSAIQAADSTFICKGVFSCIFSLHDTACVLQNTFCTVLADNSGSVAQLVHSRMKCQELRCVYTSTSKQKAFAAVKTDAISEVNFIPNCEFKGFTKMIYTGNIRE